MGKVKYHELSKKEQKEYLGDLYTMISIPQNREEMKKFFKDILTLSETVMVARRVQIAKMLLQGKKYDQIKKKLRVGNNTINQVDKWLNEGFGGYQQVMRKYIEIRKKQKKVGKKDYTPMISLKGFRKSHPAHFSLINLILGEY